jgi:hypothetical protein
MAFVEALAGSRSATVPSRRLEANREPIVVGGGPIE